MALGCVFISATGKLPGAATDLFPARAEKAFQAAEQTATREPTNINALLRFARAAFDWAEFARGDNQREEVSTRGVNAARSVIARSGTNAGAYYWLGMNLGQLARTKSLGALKLVREMEEVFLRARQIDPHFDFAGPDRSLGLLYRDAPGWPASIGNKKKAREHLERAVELHPEFPDNRLALVESFAEWDDKQNFERQLTAAATAIEISRSKFTGEQWEQSWADWNKRLAQMQAKKPQPRNRVTSKGGR